MLQGFSIQCPRLIGWFNDCPHRKLNMLLVTRISNTERKQQQWVLQGCSTYGAKLSERFKDPRHRKLNAMAGSKISNWGSKHSWTFQGVSTQPAKTMERFKDPHHSKLNVMSVSRIINRAPNLTVASRLPNTGRKNHSALHRAQTQEAKRNGCMNDSQQRKPTSMSVPIVLNTMV